MQNHFELFGLQPTFRVDETALERSYREIQSRVHPDRFAHAGDAERRASLQWTTRVNEAYRSLKNPVQRASHILALHGVDVAFETNTSMPAAFLGQQLELREALENATREKDVKGLAALEKSITRDKQVLEQKLAQSIDADKDYQAAAGFVRELQFLEKFEAEIDGAYEVIE